MSSSTANSSPLTLDTQALTFADVVSVARGARRVEIGPRALKAMTSSRAIVEAATVDGEAHYGINTGFGSLSRKRIDTADLAELQRNLVRSHASGVGEALSQDVVRGMMLLLAASLCRGMSGVRPVMVEQIVTMLNKGVIPHVPSVGSVGASGDLAPLAHVALSMIGEGHALASGGPEPTSAAFARVGIRPIELGAKEGLALINGTHLMAAQAALLCHDFDALFEGALVATAMSIDACRGTDAFLDPRVYAARNHPGPAHVASRLRELLRGSQIIPSHRMNDPRVQDPYCLRCAPAVLGASWDAAAYVKVSAERELGAVTDNPLVLADGGEDRGAGHEGVVSAGNFHGMPIAIPLDTLSVPVSHIAGISERRVYFMLGATDPQNQIPAYLSPRPGLHSGLMIAQYTAAACCNEIAGLCMPASVVNIPTSAGIEDYNSFGPRSAAKARRALELAFEVVAIELLCASEAIEYQRPLRSGDGVESAHARIRSIVPRLTADRPPAPDIAAISAAVRDRALTQRR